MSKYLAVFNETEEGEVLLGLCDTIDEAKSLVADSGRCGEFRVYIQVGSRRRLWEQLHRPCREGQHG